MIVAIKTLENERAVKHRVRGTGFYIDNLKRALEKENSSNEYIYFTREQSLPKNIDLVHYPYFEPFFLTLPLSKPAPAVVTVHDLIPLVFPQYFPAGIKGNLRWQVQKLSLKNCQEIITDSESSKKDIVRFTGFPEDKVNVIYLAPAPEFKKLEPGAWNLKIKEKYHLPDIFSLYVGDATWNKNLPTLVQAVKQTNIPLVMVGKALVEEDFDRTNPWNQDLAKVHDLAKDNPQILRLGFVPGEDLVGLYNLANAFVMPSLYEGFGLPVLEAMACGCPVVTSANSSLKEIAGEAAIFVEPQDPQSIAEGLKKALDPQSREGMKTKGFTQAKKFSWEKTARETLAIYRKISGKS